MKRGLVSFDAKRNASRLFEGRLDALRAKMAQAGVDVALVYGDVSRSSGMDYLTNFCLYWNEGVLVVPRDGPPVLVMKLSKRVQPWIRTTTVLDDIRSGPRLAQNIAGYVREKWPEEAVTIGIIDREWWPDVLLEEVKAAMPTATCQDLPGAIRGLRLVPDEDEQVLLRQAGRLLREAMDEAGKHDGDPARGTEVAVREARLRGFLDVDVRSRLLEDGSKYIDAIAQYRYVWLRLCRPRGGSVAKLTSALLDSTLGRTRAGVTERELSSFVNERIGGMYRHAFSCTSQPDIETGGAFRAESEEVRPLLKGEVVSLVLTLFHGNEVIHAAETVLVGTDSVERLTA